MEDIGYAFEGIIATLPEIDIQTLQEAYTIDKVEKDFFQLPLDKASGIDGFNTNFYRKNWSLVKHEGGVVAAIAFPYKEGGVVAGIAFPYKEGGEVATLEAKSTLKVLL
uniref:Uncharacterized protein n=1 Tax=Cannabis sativa TaxID=3483 RepID=A0A803P0F5_CANSA